MNIKPFLAAIAVTICCLGNEYPAKAFDARSQFMPQTDSFDQQIRVPGHNRCGSHSVHCPYVDGYNRRPRRKSNSYYSFY